MIHAYHQPSRLDEALELVARGATPVAGATALYASRARRDLELVDVTGVGLDELRVEGEHLSIGAAVTLSRLVAASEMPGMPGALLRRGARAVASHQLRNVITVGGNIAHLAYWADLPVVLLALDAELEVRRQGEAPARVPLADALAPGRHAWQGGLITRVLVPLRPGVFSFGHERFARTAADYSLATVCVTFRLEGGSATEVRLVAGAVQNRPLRVAAAEAALEGARLASDRIEQAASALATSVPIAPNFRASPEYRRKLLAALARRAIGTAAHWSARES